MVGSTGEKEKEGKSMDRKLIKSVWKAVNDYNMIEPGEKVMVCLSGGKDSYTMLDILLHMKKASPFNFEIIAVNLDQKQPGFPEHILPDYLTALDVPFKIIEQDTYSVVKEKTPEGKSTCSLCSRMRRGALYAEAKRLGATKIALGHHKDDIIETLFLNLFFAGKLETMPPKLKSNAGELIVIRPLAYCKEADIEQYATERNFPIIPCNLCGSQPNLQRQVIKQMVKNWEKQYPNRSEIIFNAIGNASPSHLMDHRLFDFKSMSVFNGTAVEENKPTV